MINPQFNLSDAEFSYFISSQPSECFSRPFNICNSKLFISNSENTSLLSFSTAMEELCIIGLCVDSHGQLDRFDIPRFLIEQGQGKLQEIIHLTKRFAGKYVIVYHCDRGSYIFGDATCSIQVNYSLSGEVCISSCDELVRQHCKYEISEKSLAIRSAADYSQALPNDMTMCREIRALLPNHYLNIFTREVTRFGPSPIKALAKKELTGAIETSIQRINNIVKEYCKYYEIICPLSGGWDSRLNLAFLKGHIRELQCFTFNHKRFTEKSGDFYIPTMICRDQGITHYLIEDLCAPQEYINDIEAVIGSYQSKDTMNLAYTFNSFFKGKAIISGDIIDHVGKSSIGNSIPHFLVGTRYLIAKHHNYSKEIRDEVSRYLNSLREADYKAELMDVFSMEYCCGRWAAQSSMIYSIAGISCLNIYNCLELIEGWMAIPSRLRKKRFIHKEIFKAIAPEMLQYPINPNYKYEWIEEFDLYFLVGTYAKHLWERLKYGKGESSEKG